MIAGQLTEELRKEKIQERKEGRRHNGYVLWGLIAVELFMSFSFLGYVHIEPISLTFVYIPVLVAGCILSPIESALVGMVFGLASMWKASAFYVGAGDAIFSPIMSGKPLESFLLSVVSRMLFGLVVGALYYVVQKSRHPLAGSLIVSTIGRSIHTCIVYAFMGGLFPEMGYGIANTLDDVGKWDFYLSVLLTDMIVLVCYLLYHSHYIGKLFRRIRMLDSLHAAFTHGRRGIPVMIVLVLLSSFSVAFYFTDRIDSAMGRYQLILPEEATYDILHLQIQFLLGMISLALLVVIVVIMYQKNFNYLYYEARLDGLTGLMGRGQFFQAGDSMLEDEGYPGGKKCGYFLILDVDKFKEINDRYGHPEGDRVLKSVADNLRREFSDKGILGRLGGDEFVALLNLPLSREEIEKSMGNLKRGVGDILPAAVHEVTLSIGVLPAKRGDSLSELYRKADHLLYEAKKQGRDQSVFGVRDGG